MKSTTFRIFVFAVVSCFAIQTSQAQEIYPPPMYDPGFVLDQKGNRIDQSGRSEHASGYRNFPGARWTFTATDGGGLGLGDPTTLTWSVIPNGTFIRSGVGEPPGNSTMITWLDAIYHGGGSPGGADLTQRTWWGLMDSAFNRFSELSGVTYVYEPNDDGANHIDTSGILGVRGDVRLGAKFLDGNFGILGYNFGPNSGDMVLDSFDSYFNSFSNNSERFRSVFSHEHGHGLGFAHVNPVNQTKLMEPFATTNPFFTGPQFDDLLNLHRHYGDVYEKSNGGNGNDTAANATPLGIVNDGATVEIGTSAVGLTSSRLTTDFDVDFISLDDNSETDFLSFTILSSGSVDLVLTPVGPTYLEGPQGGSTSNFFTSRLSNLTLTLVDTNGTTVLVTSNSGGLGVPEQILGESLPAGTYFARITGQHNNVQMYHLAVSATYDTEVDVAPDSFAVITGSVDSGGLPELLQSDNQYLVMDPAFTMFRYELVYTVDATSSTDTPSALEFNYESKTFNVIGTVDQKIELFNYDSGQFETIDSRLTTPGDSVVTVTPGGDATRFVQNGTGAMRARISYQNSPSFWVFMFSALFLPYETSADQVFWTISP